MKTEIKITTITDQRVKDLKPFPHTTKSRKKKGKISQQVSYTTINYFNIRPSVF